MINNLRSISRYFALALGGEWEVAWGDGTEGDFARPFCRVTPSSPVAITMHGARFAVMRQSWKIVCFPTDFPVTAESSLIEAARVERLLWRALAQGIDPASMAPERGRAHPFRIPIYSYDDLDTRTPALGDAIGYLRVVEAPSVVSYPDPSASGSAFAVVADLRVEWSEGVGLPVSGPTAQIIAAQPMVGG